LTVATVTLRHVRVDLALHQLATGDGRPLLLLHGLGERSPESVPGWASAWPGPVHALDFTGHGHSTVPTGGGYTAEALMGDADAALAHLGTATVVGRGLGAYISLLIAGARPDLVRGAVLTDGPGLAGGGPVPGSPTVLRLNLQTPAPPDPFALAELSRDVRPPDYAAAFVFQAVNRSELAEPIAVSGHSRPGWLKAVVDSPGVRVLPVDEALQLYGRS
jgi:pimeloyl-ACP methyl ester carboxylesterase